MKTPIYVQLRGQVQEIVKTDPDKALKTARNISEGWYRCQAFASIA